MMDSIKTTIISIISTQPQERDIRSFAGECFAIAETYLRRKMRSGSLDPNFFGISLEDLALDCIADLFARDDSGRFPKLIGYFEPLQPEKRSDVVLITATRRLVFSKVSEGLFRRYKEADPDLARLIRNLRYAIARTPGVHEQRSDGRAWVVFGPKGARDTTRAIIPPEFLEARLMEYRLFASSLSEIVRHVGRILDDHPSYQAAYPLTGLATVVRSALQRFSEIPEPSRPAMNRLDAHDIRYFITKSVQSVEVEAHQKYVARNKIDLSTFRAYFDAVRDILESQAISENPDNDSYFEHLKARVSSLSYQSYRNRHRAKFEYIVKKTREEFLSLIASHWA